MSTLPFLHPCPAEVSQRGGRDASAPSRGKHKVHCVGGSVWMYVRMYVRVGVVWGRVWVEVWVSAQGRGGEGKGKP